MEEKGIIFTGKDIGTISRTLKQNLETLKDKKQQSRIGLLLDVSTSMEATVGDKRAIDHLRDAVANFPSATLISFSSDVFKGTIPEPNGSTDMATGILAYMDTRDLIEKIILISDGEPNNERSTFDAARMFGKPISCIYIGHSGEGGEIFLKELAKQTGGTMITVDTSKNMMTESLTKEIRKQLPAPGRR